MIIDGKTKTYGIIGNPVGHSLSPAMQNSAFQEIGENGVYLTFTVTDVKAAIAGLKGLSFSGVSVTIPHKETVMKYLDSIDPVAAKIGAVNTISTVNGANGLELHGLNTDWLGANRALEEKIDLAGRDVVILGAGGAGRAIGFGLVEKGARITLCNRTEARGRELAKELHCNWVPLDEVDSLSGDILVNATSVGMQPNVDHSLVKKEALSNYRVVMDIVYAPLQTRLLKDAAETGCATVHGLEMLLYQGVEQFEIWTGRKAPVEVMREALMRATGNL